jgi:hypothetical protein
MKKEEIHSAAMTRFQMADDFERIDREAMSEDLAFAGGEQWPDEIKEERQKTDRPCLTFNRLPAFIEQVLGDARQNKPAIKVHPIDDNSDPKVAEIYEGLIRNIESQSHAPTAYITALTHAVTGSRGAWRIVTEYTDDDSFEQDIKVKRIINPFSVYWDPNAVEYDKSDAKWCFVSEWMTKEAFESKWPDASPHDWPAEYRSLQNVSTWLLDDRVRVAEYWVKEPATKDINLMSNGQTYEGDFKTGQVILEDGSMLQVMKTRKVKTHNVVRYLLSGHTVLEGPETFPSRYIPIIPCFGPEEFVGDVMRHRSLVRYAKDAQKMYNFWQTTIAEKIALAPKSPWLVTTNMVKGLEPHWAASNIENRAYLPFNVDPDAPGMIPQRQAPAAVNQAEIAQSQQAVEDLKATMGLYDASLGARSNETSGRAIIARQREGDTATFAWIDNLSRSIEHTGRILVDLIPKVYDTQRIVRVLGEDDTAEMVPINIVEQGQVYNDITLGKYDVAITVGPSYATKRMEAAESLIQFVQAFPQAGQVAGDLIAKNMDWPGADDIADRLRAMLPPGIEDEDLSPEEMQVRQQQAAEAKAKEDMMFELEVQTRAVDIGAKKAKIKRDLAEAESTEIESELTAKDAVEGFRR